MFRGRSASPYAMPDWTAVYAPRRCQKCGQPQSPGGPADMLRQMADTYNTYYAPVMDNLTRLWGGGAANPWTAPAMAAYGPWQQALPGTRAHKPGRRHEHDCACDDGDCDGCHGDNCHCRCCLTDADLVINARLGETRVVALTIENPRRRERQVKLELGNWTTRGGSPADIKARIVPPAEFTLEPCEERDVIVVVEAGLKTDQTPPQGDVAGREPAQAVAGLAAFGATAATNDVAQRRVPDVEQCEVFYADLRVEGCDMRPVRLALVLLPRDCGAHPIDCGCGCC
jgi:hypothetical protein